METSDGYRMMHCRLLASILYDTRKSKLILVKRVFSFKKRKGLRIIVTPLYGAVDWNRTSTALQPPAPQAGASTNSATTAKRKLEKYILEMLLFRPVGQNEVSIASLFSLIFLPA
jgi:hypothetical protein